MSNIAATRPLALALVALGSSLIGSGTLAQESGPVDEITVQSTRYVVRAEPKSARQIGRTETGIPVSQVEIVHHVRFDDLDLVTDTGARALQERIRAVAENGCRNLETFNPPLSSNQECIAAAVREARPRVEAAIAKARRAG